MTSGRLKQINIVLLCGFFGTCAYLWNKLPAQLPFHFGASGRADYAPISPVLWFALPCVGVAVSALMYSLCRYAAANPQSWNTPNRDAFLRSSAAEREPIHEVLCRGLAWTAILCTVEFAYLQAVVLFVGMRRLTAMPSAVELVSAALVIAALAVPIIFAVRATRMIAKIQPSG